MREIGGYMDVERYHGTMLHDGAIALNCGRNALAYVCEARDIKDIYIPALDCDCIANLLDRIGVHHHSFSITSDFMPIVDDIPYDAWIYVVNYYGQIDNTKLEELRKGHPHLIVDNTQSYFQEPVDGLNTLYTCRKYFGVADGAFLYTDVLLDRNLPQGESFERMRHVLGRYERSANEFYEVSKANDSFFDNEPIKRMSRLTDNLLHGIDYTAVAERRQENFEYLNCEFKDINKLTLSIPYGAFMYPLLVEDGVDIRPKFWKKGLYIPMLWTNVLQECAEDSIEYCYTANILPLPVDQRYDIEDMKYLAEIVREAIHTRTNNGC